MVCTAVRSCPIMAAEFRPWPMTSPTTSAVREPGSFTESNQSPPTLPRSVPGR